MYLAWWVSMDLRQSQGYLLYVGMLSLTCHLTSWNKSRKTCSGWLLPKNWGSFAMGIRNKLKPCLKTHSCSSFSIFSISYSVRTLRCWDNWEGFLVSASNRNTDAGCVNKGKYACTSYLMPSSLDIKEYYISVLLLFSLHSVSSSVWGSMLVHLKIYFSLFFLRDAVA